MLGFHFINVLIEFFGVLTNCLYEIVEGYYMFCNFRRCLLTLLDNNSMGHR